MKVWDVTYYVYRYTQSGLSTEISDNIVSITTIAKFITFSNILPLTFWSYSGLRIVLLLLYFMSVSRAFGGGAITCLVQTIWCA